MTAIAAALELAGHLLTGMPSRPQPADRKTEADWGAPLLARLHRMGTADADPAAARTAMVSWAGAYRTGAEHTGLFGRGLAGFTVGLSHARVVEPRFGPLAETIRQRLVDATVAARPPTADVAFRDYDLIVGMAGVLLALATFPDCAPEHVRPAVRYLLQLCDSDDLGRLRVGTNGDDPLVRWNVGRLNHGLGHGIPGVLAALLCAWRILPADEHDELAAAVRRLADLLARTAYRDARGVLTWTPGSLDGQPPPSAVIQHRQAWCYGTPGIARQLVAAGRLLSDSALEQIGIEAMVSLCAAWTDDYLDTRTIGDQLGFCHGAAGMVAAADAFAEQTGHRQGTALAEHLTCLIVARLHQVAELADTDPTMLTGAGGILAVLMTTPTNRSWLVTVGMSQS